MSCEREPGRISFFCDNPNCDSSQTFASDDFVACKLAMARENGWHSTKRVNGPWLDWCGKCLHVAKAEQERVSAAERDRERLKARNARE